jgi:hypothetical protein
LKARHRLLTVGDYVTVQTVGPCGDSPGAIEEGFYIVRAGEVILVNAKGVPRTIKGKTIQHKLRAGETARGVAWQLTKRHAPNRRPSFNGPIRYFDPGKI